MKKPLLLVALTLAILFVIYLYSLRPVAVVNVVTLKAPYAGQQVQMFAVPGSGADAFADFPDGTPCTFLDGPIQADFGGGMTSYYDKLTCHGVSGYVNVKWVR